MPQQVYFTIDTFTSDKENNCSCSCSASPAACTEAYAEIFNTLTIKLPQYFTSSMNPNKNVQIEMVRLFDIENEKLIIGSAHSDLIMLNATADFYVCATNVAYPHPKTFTISDNKGIFNMWFKTITGSVVDIAPSKARVIVEMILSY